jgi:hypothetical protein
METSKTTCPRSLSLDLQRYKLLVQVFSSAVLRVSIPVGVMISQVLRPRARPAQRRENHTMLRQYFWNGQESKKSGSQQWALNPPQMPLFCSAFFSLLPSFDKYSTDHQTARFYTRLFYSPQSQGLLHSLKSRSPFYHIRHGYSWPSSDPKLASAASSSSSGQAVHDNHG